MNAPCRSPRLPLVLTISKPVRTAAVWRVWCEPGELRGRLDEAVRTRRSGGARSAAAGARGGPRSSGSIAGAIQYRHLSVQIFEGYAGTSDSGFRAEVESEQTLARGEHLLAMIGAHEHTHLAGPPAAEAERRLA
jgi:hypothetical protein